MQSTERAYERDVSGATVLFLLRYIAAPESSRALALGAAHITSGDDGVLLLVARFAPAHDFGKRTKAAHADVVDVKAAVANARRSDGRHTKKGRGPGEPRPFEC